MPIEHINKTDTLNEGRVKLNNAITAFNETVVEGDSSVEAAQARVDEKGVPHPTLKARIDDGMNSVNQQLAHTEEYLDDKKMDKNTTSIGLYQLDKEKGLIDETWVTEEFKEQMSGNTPIHSTPKDRSIYSKKIALKGIKAFDTNFAKSKNLSGEIVNLSINGADDNATFNDTDGAYSYVSKLEEGKTYTVSKSISNRFRLATTNEYPKKGDKVSRFLLNGDWTNEHTFTLEGDENYLVAYITNESSIPSEFQIEEGEEKSDYSEPGKDIEIDFRDKSIKNSAVKNSLPIGYLYGRDSSFDLSLINKKIIVKDEGGFLYANNETYEMKGGVYSFADYQSTQSFSVCFNTDSRELEFIRHSSIKNNSNLVFIGTIRRDKNIYNINGLHTLEGKELSLNSSNQEVPFIITDIVDNFEADDYTETLSNSILDVNYVYGKFDELVSNYPNYVTKVLGTEEDSGLPIYEYHFSVPRHHGVNVDIPKIYIQSGIHGHEWGCVAANILFFKELCENWETKSSLRALRYNVDFVVVPLLNPWGRNNSASGGGGVTSRKNYNGVDLARNFPDGWTFVDDQSSMYYAGEEPLSEKETQYVVDFMENNVDVIFALDLHNFGNYPINQDYVVWAGSNDGKISKLLTGYGNQVNGYLFDKGIGESDSLFRLSTTTKASFTNEWIVNNRKAALLELPYEIDEDVSQKHSVSALGNLILSIVKHYNFIM